jgi:flagellar motor switch protein FliM
MEAAEELTAYSFGRAGQMSTDQIRAIALVNDGIARKLTNTMGAWLRSQIQIGLAATDPMAFAEYLHVTPDVAYTCVLRLEPLGGTGVIDAQSTLTEIEEGVLSSVLAVLLRELNAAWEAVGLRFVIERSETLSNVARLLEPGERTLLCDFLVQVQDAKGSFNLCLPAVVLNTIHRRLVTVNDQPRRRFEGAGQRVTELVGGAEVRATLRLPTVKISSREVQALEPGYVLQLALPRYTSAELSAGGVRVCDAVPVGRGEHRAALVRTAEKAARETEAAVTVAQLAEGVQK